MKKQRLVLIVLLAGIAAAAAALWLTKPWLPATEPGVIAASGTVDATEVMIAFRAPGVLDRRPVDEGSVVAAGEPLAALDAREAAARLRQAEAAAEAARARLRDLERGYRPQEIAEARAQAALAQANLALLREEAERSEALLRTGAVSRQRRDKDATAAAVAAQQHRAAAERLALLQSGYRKDEIAAAQARLAEAQAAAEAARVALADHAVASPIAGTVTRKHAEPGETLGAGRPVVTVTDLARPWVRVYIPERHIGRVKLGAPAHIRVDSHPGRDFAGRVTYVAAQAEFTPKNVQTQEERVKLVFAVNVAADNPEGVLKPGMPADVYIDAGAEALR